MSEPSPATGLRLFGCEHLPVSDQGVQAQWGFCTVHVHTSLVQAVVTHTVFTLYLGVIGKDGRCR